MTDTTIETTRMDGVAVTTTVHQSTSGSHSGGSNNTSGGSSNKKKGGMSARDRSFRHETSRVARRRAFLGRDLQKMLQTDGRVGGHRVTRRYLTAASNLHHVLACQIVNALHENQMTEKGESRATGGLLVAAITEVLGTSYGGAAKTCLAELEAARILHKEQHDLRQEQHLQRLP
jgi:hypothetical protein